MPDRFFVDDDIKWGKLVKSWATGRNYFDSSQPAPSLPRSLDEVRDQCARYGFNVHFPDVSKGVAFIQYSEEVVAIKLPPKTMVEESEADFKDGGQYAIPKFYDDFYSRYPAPLSLPDADTKLDFHAARIGDYSVRMCI